MAPRPEGDRRSDLQEPGPWVDDAACRDVPTRIFFPGAGEREAHWVAMFCDECPVRQACLEFALANHERWGIWGGKTEQQRRHILRARRLRLVSVVDDPSVMEDLPPS